jgi:hypothetical protein
VPKESPGLLNRTEELGAVIWKKTTFEVPPPGLGLTTVTLAVPANTMSAASMAAVNWLLLTKVVGRGPPFQLTTDSGTKPVPLRVSVKLGPPGATAAGTSG